MDHENIPVSGEMSQHEAAEWGRVLASVPEHERAALHAWVTSGDYVAEGTGDLPSLSDFEERYAGQWDSFEDYAHGLADDIDLLTDVPEEIVRYFDWNAWTRDLAFDHTFEPTPAGGVFVFRVMWGYRPKGVSGVRRVVRVRPSLCGARGLRRR